MMHMTFPVVTDADFPDGLMCPDCRRVIDVGRPYTERLDGMIWNTTTVILVCVYCA